MDLRKRNPVVHVALAAALISFLVFFRSIFGDFVNFDDPRFVTDNPGIRQLSVSMLLAAFTEQFSNDYWAPLTWISYAVDYRLWGLNPVGYHLGNILIHAVNTGLVVLTADRLWRQLRVLRGEQAESAGGYGYAATLLLAGLFWGLHPLRVESVAWIAERKDVLYGMLALVSILCYLRYAETFCQGGGKGEKRYYYCALAAFSLALMAKPTSVFVPMLLVVADWYPYRCLQRGRIVRVLLEKVPFFVLSALVTMLTIVKMSMTSAPYSYSEFPFMDRVIVSGHAIIDFCRLLLFPAGIHLFNTIAPVLAAPGTAYAKTAVVAAFSCYAIYAWRSRPVIMAVWLAFLIPLLPTLPFFQVGVDVAYSSRHSYLPSVVPIITAVAVLAAACRKLATAGYRWVRPVTCLLAGAVLIFHIAMTEHLISAWKNSGTLWSRVIKFNPVGRAFYYRANYLMDVGQYQVAAADFMAAAERAVEAGNPGAHNYYALGGDAFNKAGCYQDALAAFSAAIRLKPLLNYYYHRGLALKALGRQEEAAADFRLAGDERGNIELQQLW